MKEGGWCLRMDADGLQCGVKCTHNRKHAEEKKVDAMFNAEAG